MSTTTRLTPLAGLVALLSVSLVCLGLLVPSTAVASAAMPDDPCAMVPTPCVPPPLLNKQLLQDEDGLFRATLAQQTSLRTLETQAVSEHSR